MSSIGNDFLDATIRRLKYYKGARRQNLYAIK